MGRKRDTQFGESAYMNNRTYMQYYNRLTELALSMFEWKNLPKTVDQRFLEMCLFSDGMCVFFEDEVLGYLGLRCMIGGKLNVYQIPTDRRAYATNGCVLKGNAPADDIRKICSIYDDGITFWKNPSEVGNYSLDNSLV